VKSPMEAIILEADEIVVKPLEIVPHHAIRASESPPVIAMTPATHAVVIQYQSFFVFIALPSL